MRIMCRRAPHFRLQYSVCRQLFRLLRTVSPGQPPLPVAAATAAVAAAAGAAAAAA